MAKRKQQPLQSQQRTVNLDLDRLVDPKQEDIDKDLLCQICMDIVQDPVECKNCQTVYCNQCVTDWKKSKNQCPNQCKGKWILQAPHKKYKQSLGELKFKCAYADKGCISLVTFDNYVTHEASCPLSGKPPQTDKKDEEKKVSNEETKSDDQQDVWWCFKGDNGKWVTYETEVSKDFEKEFQAKKKSIYKKIHVWEYEIDFIKMAQINRTTLRSRDIQRKVLKQKKQEIPEELPQEKQTIKQLKQPEKKYKWQWLNKDHGKNEWNDFNAELNKTIEEGFQAFEDNKRRNVVKFLINGKKYEIDFNKKLQKNISTGYEREVDRKEDS